MKKRPAEELEFGAERNGESSDAVPATKKHSIWHSVRLTFVICSFLAMTLQLCMRNSLSTAILCMTPGSSEDRSATTGDTTTIEQCSRPNSNASHGGQAEKPTELGWTREQGVLLQGTFYWGYAVTMPFAGQLSDRFGGKLFLIISLSVQASVFLLIPIAARFHYYAAVAARIIQGVLAGFCVPSIYQLFTTWAHPTERTVGLSVAFGGFSIGTLIAMPVSSFFCKFGWDVVFYVVGAVSLVLGLSFVWLIYNRLDDHPRISKEEYEFLSEGQVPKMSNKKIPWRKIFTSVPVISVIITHFFHTYGLLMLSIMLPRYLKEATKFSLSEVGKLGALIFAGPVISKILILFCGQKLERKYARNSTRFRRILHVACNLSTVLLIGGLLFMSCRERWLIVAFWIVVAILGDLAFSAAYWPSLLYIAPSYAGLLSGIANCIGTSTGFIIPPIVAAIVKDGTYEQWDIALSMLLVTYAIDAFVFGCFGSFRQQPWGRGDSRSSVEAKQRTSSDSSNL